MAITLLQNIVIPDLDTQWVVSNLAYRHTGTVSKVHGSMNVTVHQNSGAGLSILSIERADAAEVAEALPAHSPCRVVRFAGGIGRVSRCLCKSDSVTLESPPPTYWELQNLVCVWFVRRNKKVA